MGDFSYDAAGNLTGASFSDGGSLSYTLDADGNVLSMTDATGATTYTYNTLDQLTQKKLPGGNTVDYNYDPAGNLLSLTDNKGTVSYGYNVNDQVTSVTDRNHGNYRVGYDADGNLTSSGGARPTTAASIGCSTRAVRASRLACVLVDSGGYRPRVYILHDPGYQRFAIRWRYTCPGGSRPTRMAVSIVGYVGRPGSRISFSVIPVLHETQKKMASGRTSIRLKRAQTLAIQVEAGRDFPRTYKFCSWHVKISTA